MYVAQLLPDLAEARVIREALNFYLTDGVLDDDERDTAWAVLADLTKKMRDKR